MRIIVFGIGAIGGVIAAQLSLAGHSVIGIARGAQLEAVHRAGLALLTPMGRTTATFPVYADPREVSFNSDDLVLLAMKSQDTGQALSQLRAAGVADQPIFCFQNGVSNELLALRFFENVYGVTVMLPGDFEKPGEVVAYGAPNSGVFDIGRYPAGTDAAVENLCGILNTSRFLANARNDVMSSKYRKLLANLRNIIDAAFGDEQLQKEWFRKVLVEGEAVPDSRRYKLGWIGYTVAQGNGHDRNSRTPTDRLLYTPKRGAGNWLFGNSLSQWGNRPSRTASQHRNPT